MPCSRPGVLTANTVAPMLAGRYRLTALMIEAGMALSSSVRIRTSPANVAIDPAVLRSIVANPRPMRPISAR